MATCSTVQPSPGQVVKPNPVRPITFFMSFHDKTKAVLRPLFALLAITAAAGMVPPAYAGTVVVKNAAAVSG